MNQEYLHGRWIILELIGSGFELGLIHSDWNFSRPTMRPDIIELESSYRFQITSKLIWQECFCWGRIIPDSNRFEFISLLKQISVRLKSLHWIRIRSDSNVKKLIASKTNVWIKQNHTFEIFSIRKMDQT